jgi:hypothetical protein
MIRVRRIEITKEQFRTLPRDERALLLLMGHAMNQIAVLKKLVILSTNKDPADPIEGRVSAAQSQVILRILTGAVAETWEFLRKPASQKIIGSYLPLLDKDGTAAHEELNKYFGGLYQHDRALAALGLLPAVLQQRQLLVAADERCAGRPRLNRCGTIWRWPVKVRRERPRPSRDDLMVRGRYHRRAELSLLDATAFSQIRAKAFRWRQSHSRAALPSAAQSQCHCPGSTPARGGSKSCSDFRPRR